MKFFFYGLLLISVELFPQSQSLSINNYRITLDNTKLSAFDESNLPVFEMSFTNPISYVTDLDSDLSEELLIIDSSSSYILYIFNTIDSFYIADSINSGSIEPYYTIPEELNEVVIVTGNSELAYMDKENEGFLPLNCWKYESGELYEINDEIYDIFIAENEALIAVIDDYFHVNIKDCSSAGKIKGAIAAVYLNYINAGEQSLASQFIKNYYLCSDNEQFKLELDELLLNREY